MMAAWFKRKSGLTGDKPNLSKDTPVSDLAFVVFDTEFTSLDHRTNRLLSVGAVAMEGASIRVGEQFYRVVNPEASIPAESVVIHKLRAEDVRVGEPLRKALDDFCQFTAGTVLVGHFVEMDLKILRKEMASTGHQLDNPAIDTARVHQWLLRKGPYSEDLVVKVENLGLDSVARHYKLEPQDAHHALSDAFVTACIWQRMLHMLQKKGIVTLGKLLKVGGV